MNSMTKPPSADALTGRQMARATLLLVTGMILSRILGLVRESVLASVFGAGMEYEAYLVAARPPDTLYFIVAGGALGSAFIPTFTDYLQKKKSDEAWHVASATMSAFMGILVILSIALGVFALPVIRQVLAPEFSPEQQILAAQLMRIMLITPVIFCISGLFMGILNTYQRFLLPALAPAFYNLGIILGALFLSPVIGIFGLAWGVVGGALLHMLVQVPGIIRLNPKLTPSFDLRHVGVKEVFRLTAPRMLGLAIVQINFWVNIALATSMLPGSTSALARAWMIFMLPQGVIAQSAANAAFPTFAVHSAKGETDKMRESFNSLLGMILFLAIPATAGIVILRVPIVQIILQYNEFTPTDTLATAWALLFYAPGLISHSLVEIVTRAFYAMHDTRTPVTIGGVAMLINVALSFVFIEFIGDPGDITRGPFAGLALANTLATTIEALILFRILHIRLGGIRKQSLSDTILKTSISSTVLAVVVFSLIRLFSEMNVYLSTAFIIVIGVFAFLSVSLVLRTEQALSLFSAIKARLHF